MNCNRSSISFGSGLTGYSDEANRDRPYSPFPPCLIVTAAECIAATYSSVA